MIPDYDEMHKEFLQILSDEHQQTNALLATIDMIKQQLKEDEHGDYSGSI